ncbi:MAG: type II toxin-antitoxin system VapC family toxin [Desulfobacterales bacterium]|nr:type II toxin-antitoxin system VapC family toxin [Desulfobacterales bacterium]
MILDTCALLWLADRSANRLSTTALDLIESANFVYVSAISGFEIGAKISSGKLQLPVSVQEWFHIILDFHHIEQIDLNLEICLKAAELPKIHKDPCDRFIIATALLLDMPVVTTDRCFAEYGVRVLS